MKATTYLIIKKGRVVIAPLHSLSPSQVPLINTLSMIRSTGTKVILLNTLTPPTLESANKLFKEEK